MDAEREAQSGSATHPTSHSRQEAEWEAEPKPLAHPSICSPSLILFQALCLATGAPVATQRVSLETPLAHVHGSPLP